MITSETASTEVKEASPLEVIYEKLNDHNTQLSTAVGRINTAMDKIVGPQPPHPVDAPDVSPEDTLIAKILGMLGQQGDAIQSLHAAVRRISALS